MKQFMYLAVVLGVSTVTCTLLFPLFSMQRKDVYNTPLHDAVKGGDKEVVRKLLDAGVLVNVVDGFGNTPQTLAAERGYGEIWNMLSRAAQEQRRRAKSIR